MPWRWCTCACDDVICQQTKPGPGTTFKFETSQACNLFNEGLDWLMLIAVDVKAAMSKHQCCWPTQDQSCITLGLNEEQPDTMTRFLRCLSESVHPPCAAYIKDTYPVLCTQLKLGNCAGCQSVNCCLKPFLACVLHAQVTWPKRADNYCQIWGLIRHGLTRPLIGRAKIGAFITSGSFGLMKCISLINQDLHAQTHGDWKHDQSYTFT